MSNIVNVRALLTGQVAENTILMYEESWKKYMAFAGCPVKAMDAAMLVRFRQHLIVAGGYSASTVNNHIKGVKRIAKELHANKQIDRVTYLEMRDVAYLPKNALLERKRPHNKVHIEPEQMGQLCRNLQGTDSPLQLRDQALMFTLATTGCRLSEALFIKMRDIKKMPSGNYMVTGILGKWQGEPRSVPLSAEAFDAIRSWLTVRPVQSEYIFTGNGYNEDGSVILYHDQPMKRQTAGYRIKEYARTLGIDHLKAHDFRRFVATQLIKKDGIRTAQKVLGHANISTTAQYDTESFLESITANIF